MEPICYIFGAMPPGPVHIARRRAALCIAADGGLRHMEALGLTPDLVVGDFDSLGAAPAGDNVIRHPVEKDDTDMLLAIKTGLRRGCRDFVLYGGLGGRLDHTYANLQALSYLASQGGRGFLLGERQAVTALREGSISFPSHLQGDISVFCPGEQAEGVTLTGLHYPLKEAVLTAEFPLGVSNHFTGRSACVCVRRGTLLVMWNEDCELLVERI